MGVVTDTLSYAARPGFGVTARFRAWFGLDDDWVRPRPRIEGRDVWFAALVEAFGLFALELYRSLGAMEGMTYPRWVQWLAVSSGTVLLIGRRRWPLTVAVLAGAHMFIVGVVMPVVMGQLALQIAYGVAFFSAVAWARDRRLMAIVMGAIVVFMFGWIAWQLALGKAVSDLLPPGLDSRSQLGWFAPLTAVALLTVLINFVFFAGTIGGGQLAWRSARQRASLAEQSATITAQAQALQRQAVLDERLRIARELHDVVGHHVSVIGIQAGAARRVMTKDPAAAGAALTQIETSSRDAVTQMRGLVGTLRDLEHSAPDSDSAPDPSATTTRAPEPSLADLPALIAERRAGGLDAAYELVENPPGAAATLTGPQSLTLYRVAQEALANVTRHSTARTARVVVRVSTERAPRYAEVEVVDDGRPRSGTSGSGLGQLGIRERAASLGGSVEIGPRALGGYRVRLRMPLGDNHE